MLTTKFKMEGRIGYCYSNPDEEINTGKSLCMTGVQTKTQTTEVYNTLHACYLPS